MNPIKGLSSKTTYMFGILWQQTLAIFRCGLAIPPHPPKRVLTGDSHPLHGNQTIPNTYAFRTPKNNKSQPTIPSSVALLNDVKWLKHAESHEKMVLNP
jgi:hypothetical protein